MSTTDVGEKLLGEVHEESLDELLRDLRRLVPDTDSGTPKYLGLKDLDRLINIFLGGPIQTPRSRPTTAQLNTDLPNFALSPAGEAEHQPEPNARLNQEFNWSRKSKRCPVVEISSPSSGAGKTQLLYYIISISVLPESFHGIQLDGRNAAVVVLDNDARFDVHRLADVIGSLLRGKIDEAKQGQIGSTERGSEDLDIPDGDYDQLVRDVLQHVHIFRPQSSSALLETLRSLDTYLLDLQQHLSAPRTLHSIILDSASAFYWQDRLREDVARTEDIGRSATVIEHDREQGRTFHIQNLYRDILSELKQLQTCFDCSIVFTTWGVSTVARPTSTSGRHGFSSRIYAGPPSFRPHLPVPWGTFPTLRLVVQRDAVRPFGLGAVIAEAERDASIRQEVVHRGKFSVWVDTWGREEWAPSITEALDRLPERGAFPLWITDDGVFTKELLSHSV